MTLKSIRSAIVDRLRRGESIGTLEDELADELAAEKAKEAAHQELLHLAEVASQRQEWQRRADALQARCQRHGTNIDAYLKACDGAIAPLVEAVERSKAIVEAEKAVFNDGEGFHDADQFRAAVNDIPKGFLPDGFSCPFLVMEGGLMGAEKQGVRAVVLMQQALALLAGLKKSPVSFPQKTLDEGL